MGIRRSSSARVTRPRLPLSRSLRTVVNSAVENSSVDHHQPHRQIPLVGLVGGVGSGKSTIGQGLAQRMDVAILDADVAGHDALRQPEVKHALRTAFGAEIFDPAGEIVRPELGRIVFGDTPSARKNRESLERIVHPVIRSVLREQLTQHRSDAKVEAVLLDAALLLESGWESECDGVVFIDTPLERRQRWTGSSRAWSVEEHARREASQWPLDKKRAASDFVVDNSGDASASVDQLEKFVRGIVSLVSRSSAPH